MRSDTGATPGRAVKCPDRGCSVTDYSLGLLELVTLCCRGLSGCAAVTCRQPPARYRPGSKDRASKLQTANRCATVGQPWVPHIYGVQRRAPSGTTIVPAGQDATPGHTASRVECPGGAAVMSPTSDAAARPGASPSVAEGRPDYPAWPARQHPAGQRSGGVAVPARPAILDRASGLAASTAPDRQLLPLTPPRMRVPPGGWVG